MIYLKQLLKEELGFLNEAFLAYEFDKERLFKELEKQGITPKYPEVVADHITFLIPFDETKEYHKQAFQQNVGLPYENWKSGRKTARIVGYADGGDIEALAVEVDGETQKPQFKYQDEKGKLKDMGFGGLYHITLSKNQGVQPKKSNEVVQGAKPLKAPIVLDLKPVYK